MTIVTTVFKFHTRLSRPLMLLIAVLLTASSQARAENGWGPISLRDQFPTALVHSGMRPDSAYTLPANQTSMRVSSVWANTVNKKGRSYLVDAESVVSELEISHGLPSGLELTAGIPLVWLGGGILDRPIYDWHNFWGLPQGPRDDRNAVEDRYEVSGFNDDGSEFDLDNSGFSLGNLRLRATIPTYRFNRTFFASVLELELPTYEDSVGHEGVDLLVSGIFSTAILEKLYLHYGAAYTYYGDREKNGIEYSRHRGYGQGYLEYFIFSRSSLTLGVLAATSLHPDIKRFPEYEVYLDIGLKQALSEATTIELLLRENPAPDEGTSDVGVLLGLEFKL